MSELVLTGADLSPEGVADVAREEVTVRLSESTRAAVRASRGRVESVIESGEAVYGLNTWFGNIVDTRTERADIERVQTNLVRSHSAGVGRELTTEEVRSMMVARTNALAKGYSGVRVDVVDHLVTMLNEGVHPCVPSRGVSAPAAISHRSHTWP